jgi:hypothetical protein
MKTILLVAAFQLMAVVPQSGFDGADFSAKFKKLIELAKTYYKGEKTGTGTPVSDGVYVKAYDCVTKFNGAVVSRIIEDGDNVCQHQVHYEAADKAAAVTLMGEIKKLVVSGVPANYKEGITYDARYFDAQCVFFEYNSDVFAEVAKKPSVKMGIINKDGKHYVEVLIIESVFRR